MDLLVYLASREGRGYGPAQYGPAMQIYTDIQKASKKAATGVLQRLALRGRDLYQGALRQADADVPGLHRESVPGACPWLHWLAPVGVALVYLGSRQVWPVGVL